MMIMAQHPQHSNERQKQERAQAGVNFRAQIKGAASSNINQTTKDTISNQSQNQHQQQQQLEQDGKRTLIKNQLYVIEQLQLENANLRNERDQLQLENEELKFQLQMISSSTILHHQPSATFKNQHLDPLAESDGKIGTNQLKQHQKVLEQNNFKTNTPGGGIGYSNAAQTLLANGLPLTHQVKIQPKRQQQQQQQQLQLVQPPVNSNAEQNNQQVSYNTTNNIKINTNTNNRDLQQLAVRQTTSAGATAKAISSSSSSSSSSISDTTTPNNNNNNHTSEGKLQKTAQTSASTIIPSLSSSLTTTTATATTSTTTTNAACESGNNNKFLSTKSTSLTSFNVKPMFSQPVLHSRILPQDDEERQVKLVEQLYGDSEKVQAAAIVIQRAFRKYQICKRFRTITEQLRLTYQSVNQQQIVDNNLKQGESPKSNRSHYQQTGGSKAINNSTSYASNNPSRLAAWESLSYAASRLAPSASATTQSATKQAETGAFIAKPSTLVTSQQNINISVPSTPLKPRQQQQQTAQNVYDNRQANQQQQQQQQQTPSKQQQQDPVFAAAINFQQLESIRKRQYRVGLNIFNKNPEKGISFLIAHTFIDSTSPHTKTSSSYYQSNQLHFIDKNYIVQQQQALLQPINNYQSCLLCTEEDNLKRNVAYFLLSRKGLAKEKIGEYLGNLQAQFNQDVLKYYLQELEFYGLQIDLALRKFLSTFRLPGEAQKIEKIVDCFAQRYVQCQQQQQQLTSNVCTSIITNQISQQAQEQNLNQQQNVQMNCKNNPLLLLSKDEIFILTFAIIMLNTDLHSPSLKPTSRMSATQFVNNLRGVFKSQTINESDLIKIYERVKANQITTTPDHVTHVMKVQQGLTVTNFQRKELPNLCNPQRRLVCFCRLFEVYDVNKKERLGQHQREIFLFNDMLLVTKLARRVRANTTQLYTYRQSISLQGLYVLLFQSQHYNFGIRLCQRSNDETIIMFNARNELDQSRFVDDLGEGIAEMDEMETIKTHNIIETIHFKYLERLRTHAMMHTSPTNSVPMKNTTDTGNHHPIGAGASVIDHQQPIDGKVLYTVTSCDTRNTNNYKQIEAYEDIDSERLAGSTSRRGSKAKFSSMLNLSSACVDKKEGNSSNGTENGCTSSSILSTQQNKTLRQNRSVGQQLTDRNVDPLPGGECPRCQPTASSSGIQRRCSACSVHSLDSGLFLSRDVSPNQSS